MVEGYSIPKSELTGYRPELFKQGSGIGPEREGFIRANQDIVLFGLNPEMVSSIIATDKYARPDGTAYKSIDILFRPENPILQDEKNVIPWILLQDQGDRVLVKGGPIILRPENVIFNDLCCPCDGYWMPDIPYHVSQVAAELGLNPTKYPLSPEHIIQRSAYPDITFAARYALPNITEIGSVSDLAEETLIQFIERNGGSREKPMPSILPRPQSQRPGLVRRLIELVS
ncbi:MAG: hypothetical protein KKE20_00070 [Nanoarchaeota archaeon]|nr:hypothetical protein [Nanoarchaeota archaeon]